MEEQDRIAIMAAIVAGARAQRFDTNVREEVIAADAVRLAREIDRQVRGEEKNDAPKGPLFKR